MAQFGKSSGEQVLPLLCFGKLPVARDFLRSRGSDAGERFAHWLNASDRLQGKTLTIPGERRVLFLPGSSTHFVVAVVWGSADSFGRRRFPFGLFVEPTRALLESNVLRPFAICEQMFVRLQNEYSVLSAARSPAEFYKRLRSCQVYVGDGADEARGADALLRSTMAREFATALFGDGDAGARRWGRLLWRLWLASGGHDAATVVPTLAVCLPLAAGMPPVVQAESWLQLLRQRAGRADLVPTAMFGPHTGNDAASGRLCLWFREPRESDIVALGDGIGSAAIVDLTSEADGAPTDEAEDPAADESTFVVAAIEWLGAADANLLCLLPDRLLTRVAGGSREPGPAGRQSTDESSSSSPEGPGGL